MQPFRYSNEILFNFIVQFSGEFQIVLDFRLYHADRLLK